MGLSSNRLISKFIHTKSTGICTYSDSILNSKAPMPDNNRHKYERHSFSHCSYELLSDKRTNQKGWFMSHGNYLRWCHSYFVGKQIEDIAKEESKHWNNDCCSWLSFNRRLLYSIYNCIWVHSNDQDEESTRLDRLSIHDTTVKYHNVFIYAFRGTYLPNILLL